MHLKAQGRTPTLNILGEDTFRGSLCRKHNDSIPADACHCDHLFIVCGAMRGQMPQAWTYDVMICDCVMYI
jgi:hypothetical protein